MIKNSIATFLFFIVITTSNAYAEKPLECKDHRAFTKSVSERIFDVLENKKYNEARKEKELTKLFKRLVNINWMGKFALGRNAKELDAKQKKSYAKAYEKFLLNTYIPKFKEYSGETVEILNSTPLKRKNEHIVSTLLKRPNDPDVKIAYRVRKKGVCYQIHDISAEGVSLINTQRNDFNSVIKRKGFDELLVMLNDKNAK